MDMQGIEQLLQDPRIWQPGKSAAPACASVATGSLALDRVLGGGWPLGQLTELLVDLEGMGEMTLLLPALCRLMRPGGQAEAVSGWAAFIAPPYLPYAPALRSAGIDLSRLLVVHARQGMEDLWAMEQAVRSRTCAAVIGWSARTDQGALRRLQLAAGQSDAWVVLFRPASLRRTRSPAPLRVELSRQREGGRLVVQVIKRRGGPPATISVDLGR